MSYSIDVNECYNEELLSIHKMLIILQITSSELLIGNGITYMQSKTALVSCFLAICKSSLRVASVAPILGEEAITLANSSCTCVHECILA